MIGWRPRVNCGRGAHSGAIFSFRSTELDLAGLLELLDEMEVGVDNVDVLANVDDTLEEDVFET